MVHSPSTLLTSYFKCLRCLARFCSPENLSSYATECQLSLPSLWGR